MKKINLVLLILISILPFRYIRVFFYKNIKGYKIDHESKIGFLCILNIKNCDIQKSAIDSFNIINSENFIIKNMIIGKFNRIKNLNILEGSNGEIGYFNTFYASKKLSKISNLFLKKDFCIKNFNFFDLTDSITLDENVKIDSKCSFWTHGNNGLRDEEFHGPIIINKNCKIQSAVTIIHNTSIAPGSEIEFGSIVHKSINETGRYTSNVLIKK
jgi:acetyltransferase-like isoleucine patch superfamily enzyme